MPLFSVSGETAKLHLFGDIGGAIDGGVLLAELAELPAEVTTIEMGVLSPGGNVVQGFAIGAALKDHPAKVVAFVDSAMSIAAYIVAKAADEIHVRANGQFVIHRPFSGVQGDFEDMEDEAARLRAMHDEFVATIVTRTGMATADIEDMMSRGSDRIILAQEALEIGLADSIISPSKAAASVVLDDFHNDWKNKDPKAKDTKMEPATLEELNVAFPDSPAEFVLAQLTAKATITVASIAYAAHVKETADATAKEAEEKHKKELAEAKAAAKKVDPHANKADPSARKTPGVDPLGKADDDGDDTTEVDGEAEFHERVVERMKLGATRLGAISAVTRQDPALHRRFLEATNKDRGPQVESQLENRFKYNS